MFGMRNSITSYIIHPVHIIKWDYDVGSYGSPDIPILPPQKNVSGLVTARLESRSYYIFPLQLH